MVKVNRKWMRVKASSLVEVSTAMVITGIVFSAAIMIILNIASGSDNFQKLKYDLVLRNLAHETIQNKSYLSQRFTDEAIIIDKEIATNSDNQQLITIRLSAWRGEKVLANYKILVYEPED